MKDHGSEVEKKHAFSKGKRAAKIWMKRASYQEKKDVLYRSNPSYDSNYFAFMKPIFYYHLQRVCPEEALQFQGRHNDSFMRGWREGVIALCQSAKEPIGDEA
jgi:hypothetical protein